ncbi:MAG: hypothetical protein K2L95_04190 [Alphaproteobacteria bacterium]|nr:hypothetical protein [Alphaproteobacteria bacterium]MDE6571384.1 hypothetical protein [Alphaproteobacteria bacterium]
MKNKKAYILSALMVLLFALTIMFAFDAYQTDGKYDGLWVLCFRHYTGRLDYNIALDICLSIILGISAIITGIKLNKYFTWHWLLIFLSVPVGMFIFVLWWAIMDYFFL